MKNLVEVKPKVFIARDDPEFLKKYLFYHPNDPDILYQYALEWKRKKDFDKYYEFLEKAALYGSEKAKERLELVTENQQSTLFSFRNNTKNRKRKRFWLFFILSFLLIILSSILIGYFIDHYGSKDEKERDTKHPKESNVLTEPVKEKTSNYTEKNNAQSLSTGNDTAPLSPEKEKNLLEKEVYKKNRAAAEGTVSAKLNEKNSFIFTNYYHYRLGKKYTYIGSRHVLLTNHLFMNGSGSGSFYEKNRLIGMVLTNAIVRYQEVTGVFPENLAVLEQNYPRNFISASPTLFYKQSASRFSLKKSGQSIKQDELLSLHFYRDTNQLALKHGEKTLVVYPVASGVFAMPFTESRVSERVVNPNGGNEALGTRGIVLHDNYAIHGTNKPELIGGYVSHGCIRMNNEDIENLYPYVSINTPFSVDPGSPDTPIYGDFLPNISSISPGNGTSESAPGKGFAWKE